MSRFIAFIALFSSSQSVDSPQPDGFFPKRVQTSEVSSFDDPHLRRELSFSPDGYSKSVLNTTTPRPRLRSDTRFVLLEGSTEDSFCAPSGSDGARPEDHVINDMSELKHRADRENDQECEEECARRGPLGCKAYASSEWNCRFYHKKVSLQVKAFGEGWHGCYARPGQFWLPNFSRSYQRIVQLFEVLVDMGSSPR